MLNGKVAVITGCSKGIGETIMNTFAKNRADIFACVRNKNDEFINKIDMLMQKYNVNIIPIFFDLSDTKQVELGMKTIMSHKKSIDILVNNAGTVSENKLFQMTSIEEMKNVFEINFFSQMSIIQYISRNMIRKKSGSIINIASIAGIDGDPAQLEYVSSKAAIIGATKKLAIELGKSGVRVNAVSPGIIDTDMAKNIKEGLLQETINKTIMKRMGTSQEVANSVLFFASDLSSYITGQVLRVDGGI